MRRALAGEGIYRFLLRMPEELRARLKAAADRHGASLNSEIVNRLEASFAPPPAPSRRKEHHLNRRFLISLAVVALAAALNVTAEGVVRNELLLPLPMTPSEFSVHTVAVVRPGMPGNFGSSTWVRLAGTLRTNETTSNQRTLLANWGTWLVHVRP